jgi:peptidyl-prolyl cis-trans isomerase A (cyclophilin A)
MPNPDPPVPQIAEMIPGDGELRATFKTSMGDIVVKLFAAEVPRTVANFVALAMGKVAWTDPKTNEKVTRPLYSGTIFHRVIPEFMIQGGDPTGTGRGGPGWKFGDEIVKTLREIPTPWLDGKHAVFGHVIQNVELIPKITHSPRDPGDRPKTPIVLNEVVITRG